MANRHSVGKSKMALQADEATHATILSDRELRAMRRGMGIPVSISPTREFLAQGRRHSKRKIDSDMGSEEVRPYQNPVQKKSDLTRLVNRTQAARVTQLPMTSIPQPTIAWFPVSSNAPQESALNVQAT